MMILSQWLQRLIEHASTLDIIQLWECLDQVRISSRLNPTLLRPLPPRCSLSIARIERIHYLHSFGHLPKRREAHSIEVRVIFEIDEKLCRSCIRSCRCKGDPSPGVFFLDWVIENVCILPFRRDLRVC